MAWQFFRRMLNFVGGRIMAKLAPRLLFFQYSNFVAYETDQQKKKYRIYQIRSVAENEIYRLKMRKHESPTIGLSTVRDQYGDSSNEASIFEVHSHNDFSDTETVFSTYLEDERQQFQFIELDQSYVQDV